MRELPPIISHGKFRVVRGDKIEGGFKRLAIGDIFANSKSDSLVFATNSHGYGAIALTLSLQGSGKTPTIFLSKTDSTSRNLSWCEKLGAKLNFSGSVEPDDSVGLRAEAGKLYGAEYEILPLGLDTSQVRERIAAIAKSLFPVAPKDIWVAAASGLVARTLQEAFPFTRIHAVLVKHNSPNNGRAEPHVPEEKFIEPAFVMAPYQSAPNYDAKVWRLAAERAVRQAVIFNIA